MSEAMTRLFMLVAMVLIVALISMLLLTGEDHTCPNYGEVPALIDGEYQCIPWEVRP